MKDTSMMNTFNSIYRGIVVSNEDPNNLGRCKIRIPSIHGSMITPNILPWARMLSTAPVSNSRGSYVVPDIGDVVWVFFEGGDDEYPVYLGGTFSKVDIPINKDLVILYQDNDNALVYNRQTSEYIMNIQDSKIRVSKDDIDIDSQKSINLNSPSVTINGIDILSLINSPKKMDLMQYQAVDTSTTEVLTPTDIVLSIDVPSLDKGDIVHVTYEGLELVQDKDYTVNVEEKTLTLLNFTRMMGERAVITVTKII